MKHSHIDPKFDPSAERDDDSGERDNFLSRWSRRKAEARTQTDITSPEVAPSESERVEHEAAIAERNKLTDADMPALESLDESSDYSVFMSENVSEDLRKLALRQMFRLPKFGVLDGLNDYDEDYTTFEPLGDIVTSDMRFQMEREAEKKKQEEAERQAALAAQENARSDEDAVSDERHEEKQETRAEVATPDPSASEEDAEALAEESTAKDQLAEYEGERG